MLFMLFLADIFDVPGISGRPYVWIEDGGSIMDTESSLDVEELISKYIFEKNDN